MEKITLFLMTEKGHAVLTGFADSNSLNYIDQVIIGRDKNVENDYSSEIKSICKHNNVPFCFKEDHYTIRTVYAFAISWRWMIKIDGLKIIVLHDSLLPRYRGFAPLVNQLINGETEVGVTALFASEQYDQGPILLQKKISITYPIKIRNVILMISELYKEIAQSLLKSIQTHALFGEEQNDQLATYSVWRDESDYRIDWNKSSVEIQRFIDAVGYPYKGASTVLNGQKARILESAVYTDLKIEVRHPGKVIRFEEQFPVVICGRGLLKITQGIFENTRDSIFPLSKFRIRLE